MNEFVEGFKVDAEKLYKEMYEKLDQLVYTAMFNMSFINDDEDANFAMLQEVLIDIIKEQMFGLLNEEESN